MLGDHAAIATIAVKDGKMARSFYEGALGLTVVDEGPGVATYASGESKVFAYESQYAGTNEATAATWMVDDIDAIVSDLRKKGVSFEHYDMPDMRLEGDVHVGDGMRIAWLKDPDGNILSLVSAN